MRTLITTLMTVGVVLAFVAPTAVVAQRPVFFVVPGTPECLDVRLVDTEFDSYARERVYWYEARNGCNYWLRFYQVDNSNYTAQLKDLANQDRWAFSTGDLIFSGDVYRFSSVFRGRRDMNRTPELFYCADRADRERSEFACPPNAR